jgi:hypothetical protein
MSNMVILIGVGVVVAAICGIVSLASGDRYAKMSEPKFEAEAQRVRALSGAMGAIQKIVDPGRKVEYLLQKDKQAGSDSSESGDSLIAGEKR